MANHQTPQTQNWISEANHLNHTQTQTISWDETYTGREAHVSHKEQGPMKGRSVETKPARGGEETLERRQRDHKVREETHNDEGEQKGVGLVR